MVTGNGCLLLEWLQAVTTCSPCGCEKWLFVWLLAWSQCLGTKAYGWQEGSTLWNSQQPSVRKARVWVFMCSQKGNSSLVSVVVGSQEVSEGTWMEVRLDSQSLLFTPLRWYLLCGRAYTPGEIIAVAGTTWLGGVLLQ